MRLCSTWPAGELALMPEVAPARLYLTDPTSHGSDGEIDNLGDCVIKEAVQRHLAELVPTKFHTEWMRLNLDSLAWNDCHDQLVLCGANILSNHAYLNKHVWRPGLRNLLTISDAVLMGVGWWKYQSPPRLDTRLFYQRYLQQADVVHSVRDSYSQQMLQMAGIENVVNTGCPTMWDLPDTIQFPAGKATTVVFTLTDYAAAPANDRYLVDQLIAAYERVVLFPQGIGDVEYLQRLYAGAPPRAVEILERSMGAFDDLLANGDIDYAGTRLHGGIRALQYGCRAIIVAVDNRAETIARDTRLPIVPRSAIDTKLQPALNDTNPIQLKLNKSEIAEFKQSLSHYLERRAC